MRNNTQEHIVRERLYSVGSVSRNWCLKNYISRLGAIICDLRKEGLQIAASYEETTKPDGSKGRDYVYTLVLKPS